MELMESAPPDRRRDARARTGFGGEVEGERRGLADTGALRGTTRRGKASVKGLESAYAKRIS